VLRPSLYSSILLPPPGVAWRGEKEEKKKGGGKGGGKEGRKPAALWCCSHFLASFSVSASATKMRERGGKKRK